jgi:hypothetical protein
VSPDPGRSNASGTAGGPAAARGRYLYPAIRDMSEVIASAAGEAVHAALADAGFEAD